MATIIIQLTDEDYARWLKHATQAGVDDIATYLINEMESWCLNAELQQEAYEQDMAEDLDQQHAEYCAQGA